ncbi:MAG TPA: VOC family protein [Ktedonobacteraceae bacterium]|nr:VOC family protein [Ktedonobacteraceae bacterium]
MKIRTLDHAALLVSDVERSRHFYGQLLGLEEVARPASFDFPGAWFRMGNTELHLIGDPASGQGEHEKTGGYREGELARGHCTHFALEVDDNDLEETVRYLQARNIAIVGGPRPRGDGVMQLYISDPDNYIVELFVR